MISARLPVFSWSDVLGHEEMVRVVELVHTGQIRDKRELREFIERFLKDLLQVSDLNDNRENVHLADLVTRLVCMDLPQAGASDSLAPPAVLPALPAPAAMPDQEIELLERDRVVRYKDRYLSISNEDAWLYFVSVVKANGKWVTATEIVADFNRLHPAHHRDAPLNATKANERLPMELRDLIEVTSRGSRFKIS